MTVSARALFSFVWAVFATVGVLADAGEDLLRMDANNPESVVDLSMGIWPVLNVCDWDRDGRPDLVVRCHSTPLKATSRFMNLGTCFAAGVPGDESQARQRAWRTQLDLRLPDGPASRPHFREGREYFWTTADLDGDGRPDAVCACSDFAEYSNGILGPKTPLAYGPDGVWTNRQILAYAYWYKNLGGNGRNVKWGPAQPLETGGRREMVGPWGSPRPQFFDADGDGDLDMLTGDFLSWFWYFENVGSATAPRFAAGRRLKDERGRPLEGDLEMMKAQMLDWDGDGRLDIVAAEEDGRVFLCRNLGKVTDGMPVFSHAEFFRQYADKLKFGCLSTPCACDWDGDGDLDFVCGNSAGYIGFIENLSGPGVEFPKWAPPKLMTVVDPKKSLPLWTQGRFIRAQCGPSNSPQGPAEQRWGYTTLTVCDWDCDGFLDIVANDIKGEVVWFRNPGKRGTLTMEAAQPVEAEWNGPQPQLAWEWRGAPGKGIRTQWRTTPVAVDWTGDGLPDLVMLDTEGYLVLFERTRQNGKLVLKAPRRAFVDNRLKPIQVQPGVRGGSGRRKFCVADWNGDGRPDIVMSSNNARVYENVREEDGLWVLRLSPDVAEKRLAGHSSSPTAADFNADGIDDLVIGAEDGHFYYLRNPRSPARKSGAKDMLYCPMD